RVTSKLVDAQHRQFCLLWIALLVVVCFLRYSQILHRERRDSRRGFRLKMVLKSIFVIGGKVTQAEDHTHRSLENLYQVLLTLCIAAVVHMLLCVVTSWGRREKVQNFNRVSGLERVIDITASIVKGLVHLVFP
ncbi:unnamed protein product, partial [Discosporangium mesarthrocarpum]